LVIYEGGGGYGDHLVASGFRVEEAQSGAEGVDRVAALLPDLVVLDFDLDGETVAQIRQGPGTKDIPIIALAVLAGVHERRRGPSPTARPES
jgi:CheY-like chemotaxis protein